jgi:hypothetical protein
VRERRAAVSVRTMSDPGPLDFIAEVRREAARIVDLATEAAKHYEAGNHADAALVLGLLHYRANAATAAGDAAVDAIRELHGVAPDDALRGMGHA